MTLILIALLSTSSIIVILLIKQLVIMMRRFTRPTIPPLPVSLKDLPTVSVCIPARNETHAMTQCLERVIASSYPKLEMIVLDDASNDNTSVLIKSFAHAGVRFVEGSPLPDGWLGKTHAEHELYEEASGEFILFLDVDTHIKPQTIDNLIAIALNEKADVISVLPKRDDVFRGSVLFATLRYFWTIVLHKKSHPAVASSTWIVRRSLLRDQFGGFEQLRTAVEPERIIAAHATVHSRYRFLISTSELGISYEKKWRSQLETSTRLLYPFLGGRFLPVIGAYFLILFLLLPFAWIASALFTSWSVYHTIAVVIALLVLSSYMLYVHRVWQRGWLVGGIIFPFVLIQELCLLTASIYAYATHSVTWKGRPVTGTARSITRISVS